MLCSSVGRVTVDLIRRSWVRFTPRSKDFFFTSRGSSIPFTRANAQWVIHGFNKHFNLYFRVNSLFHQSQSCLPRSRRSQACHAFLPTKERVTSLRTSAWEAIHKAQWSGFQWCHKTNYLPFRSLSQSQTELFDYFQYSLNTLATKLLQDGLLLTHMPPSLISSYLLIFVMSFCHLWTLELIYQCLVVKLFQH